ncbi:MAG: CBS domain-containing protein [Verrucomicrobia bacterium]|nr:CBS domain-containing protein [Verrucomicrobiota bacterium]
MLNKDIDLLTVKDLMLKLGKFPCLNTKSILKEALDQMTFLKMGICCVMNGKKLAGIITDGDFRRRILDQQKPISSFLVDDVIIHSIKNPITVNSNEKIFNAVKLMEKNLIWDLPVVDSNKDLIGLLHLHPIVKKLLSI